MKVSVYCLVYNHEKYIGTALDGFVNQKTNFPYEVWVHDDASTDRSAEIVKEYAEKYPNIIKPIFQAENQYSQGVKIFSNYILPKMSGEYVAACEGDDYWIDETKLQQQVDFLDSHPEYVACVHNTFKKDMRTGKESVMFDHTKDEDVAFLNAAQEGGSCYQTSSLMYRIQYAKNRPDFFKLAKGFGDYPLAMYLTLSGKVRFLNRVMSVYRVGTSESWTKKNTLDMHNNAKNYHRVVVVEAINEYSGYIYNEELEKIILNHKYKALYFEENYPALRKPPYREIYLSMSYGYRVKTYLKQYFQGIYKFYRKLKYGSEVFK